MRTKLRPVGRIGLPSTRNLSEKFHLRCVLCGSAVSGVGGCQHSPYYDSLFAEYKLTNIDRSVFENAARRPWYEKYLPLLPFSTAARVKSLGEGNTPLIASKKFPGVFFKDEARNPSGCFKDRESAVLIPFLAERGKRKLVVASSGNAALSASLYGRLYGFSVTCFIPFGTTPAKKNLIRAFGGRIVEKGKYYEDCHRRLIDEIGEAGSTGPVNITAGVHPLKDQGNKIIAYELWEQLGIPDYIIAPLANGCLLAGIFKGFEELHALGFAKRLPVFIGVQMEDGDPVRRSLQKGKYDFEIVPHIPDSKAEGLIAMESFSSPKALYALRRTKGWITTVSEKSLKLAMKYAIRTEGLLPEWTAVSSFAALLKLQKTRMLSRRSTVVVLNTGSGLKEIVDIAETIR